ncbi:MAG: protein kinase [Deltaproteobacteria bacterium]|nr:protein kinase [Deltaproteobacteria bacterium]
MRKLLIIDAPDSDYQELANIFNGAGYEVLPLVEGERAPALAAEQRPDIILLNIQADAGLKQFRALKDQEATQQIPVVLILERFTEDYAARGLEIGAHDFIIPPFRAEEILARVGVAIRLKEDEHRLQAFQDRYGDLLEGSSPYQFIMTREGRLIDCSSPLLEVLGYDPHGESLEVSQAQDLFGDTEDYHQFQELINLQGKVNNLMVPFRHRDGSQITMLVHGLIVQNQPDLIVGYARPSAPPDQERVGEDLAKQLVARPSIRKFMRDLIPRLLPFADNLLSLLKPTDLLGGHYKKVKKLGQGSFGEVWLVLDTEALGEKRYYVAKIPFSKSYNKKFRQEGEIIRKLAPHPGVVRQIDYVEEHGRLILIQEYVEGPTLQDLLVEELPEALKERIIMQLIDIVAHAHQHQVIHRDIKPNNIIVTSDGTVKLLDYGAAKELKDRDISATMVGSRPYMAPEQIMGQSEKRSDIWAIGVIMYLLYTEMLPFYDDLEKTLIDLILYQEPVPPREENPEIPEELEAIILKCLAKKVEDRYPDAIPLKEDLLRHFPDFGQRPWGGFQTEAAAMADLS